MNATQPIHIPAYMVELIAKWRVHARKLESQLGQAPSLQDMATAMDLPLKKVRMIKRALKAFQSPQQESARSDNSLTGLGEMIADSRVGTPDDARCNATRSPSSAACSRPSTSAVLHPPLPLRPQGCEPLTLKQIADEVGISGERVRQIVDEAPPSSTSA